jgi:hypothetical protein
MPYIPLKLPPGVYRQGTQYQAANRWYDSNLVRWTEGTLRPVGGWDKRQYASGGSYLDIQVTGVMRGLHAWRANDGTAWAGAGGAAKLYALKANTAPQNITPVRETGSLSNAFSTVSGSPTVTVTDASHGLVTGDTARFTSGTAIGSSGITLSGDYVVTVTNSSTYTVQASTNASTTETSQGSANYAYEISVGRVDSENAVGYGVWTYGSGFYGTPRPQLNAAGLLEASTWAVDNWGEYLVACRSDEGKIYEWDLGAATRAALISAAPTQNKSIIVTSERFLFALGAGGNGRKVQWSDQEDNTDWTPSATNQAGDYELATSGTLSCGERTRYGTLLLTTTDAHLAVYQGPPYVYGFERVGFGCGVIGPQASVSLDNGVVWMGQGAFFIFDGTVKKLDSSVSDYIFTNINYQQAAKITSWVNVDYQEVWWHYPSEGASECDSYVVWNFRENTWMIGELNRTVGIANGVFEFPLMFDSSGYFYDHETGFNYDGALLYAESGPIEFGNGDQIMVARQVVPDEKTQGSVNVEFKTRFAPEGVETTHGPYTISSKYTDVRFSGRQVSFRIEAAELGDWRVGNFRLEAVPGSRR